MSGRTLTMGALKEIALIALQCIVENEEYREIPEHAPPGIFDASSWAYCNMKRCLSTIQTDEIRLEFDDKHFFAEPVQDQSVLDMLAEQAEDLGAEDLSLNVDHYLYELPKRSEK